MPRLSLILMVWNTAHLLGRTLKTLEQQDTDFEILVVDDNSEDDVAAIVATSSLPIKHLRLEHNFGMRGNTESIRAGIEAATGDVVMWSTPEVMLSPLTLDAVVNTVSSKRFVTVPSHGLTLGIQLQLDSVDWHSNINNIATLVAASDDDFTHRWFNLNFYQDGDTSKPHKQSYGNNQTVAVLKEQWLKDVGHFPRFYDWGSDDPWVSGKRREKGYTDVTLWEYPAYHQWHAKAQFWMAQGKAPHWNRFGHTMSNIANDPQVPAGGTCTIWDGGSHAQMTQQEIDSELSWSDWVDQTGFRRKV